jgi:hypothetical protein
MRIADAPVSRSCEIPGWGHPMSADGVPAGWPIDRTLRFTNATIAHVAARLGCAPDMAATGEVPRMPEEAP